MPEPPQRPTARCAEAISLRVLESEPYGALADLRNEAPVAWVPALDGWLVTSYDAALTVMRDSVTFTVDDPRFSTAQVLGPSMLSVEGVEHRRRRGAFSEAFRPTEVRSSFEAWLREETDRRVNSLAADGPVELRTALAGPLAAATIARFLGLVETDPGTILGWYEEIASAIVAVSVGDPISRTSVAAIDTLRSNVIDTAQHRSPSLVRRIDQTGRLSRRELESEVAVLMFGAIETSEGMIANAFWHLLSNSPVLRAIHDDRSMIGSIIEESLRLEPAATRVDRYCTRDTQLGDARILAGDLVIVSLLAANRDPTVFEDPDRFDMSRPNANQHLTFVQGPHACLGLHLARLEAVEAVQALVAAFPGIRLDVAESEPPRGLIFRKPPAVVAHLSA